MVYGYQASHVLGCACPHLGEGTLLTEELLTPDVGLTPACM